MYRYVFCSFIICFCLSQGKTKQYFSLFDEIHFVHDTTIINKPFTGGYQSLFMQVVDWDNDDKIEVLVLNSGYKIPLIYEQETVNSLKFKDKQLNLFGLNLVRWFQFVDYDSDGDWDVLTLDPEFDILGVQINTGDNSFPFFTAFQRLKNTDGDFIIPQTGNLPVLYDINRDNKLDLFITTQGAGHIEYFQNVGNDTMSFELITRQYSNVQVVSAAKNRTSNKHGKSTFAFVDFDKDGDEDILWGDQFQPLFYYLENKGSWDNPDYLFIDSSFPINTGVETNKNYNLPIITDLNNDGNQDFFMLPQTDNFNAFHFYLGKSAFGQFEQISKNFISTIDYGLISNIDFHDFTADGKDDLIISSYKNQSNFFELYFYEKQVENEKITFKKSELSIDLPWKNDFKFAYDFQIVDFDGDNVWDITFVDENGNLFKSINAGTNTNPSFLFYFEVINSLGNQVQYKISDIDSDGDLDLLYSNISGEIKMLSTETSVFSTEVNTDSIKRYITGFLSFDQNKDGDFIFYDRSSQKAYKLVLDKFNFVSATEIEYEVKDGFGSNASLALNDIDGDGIDDFIYGNFNGGLQIFKSKPASQSNLNIEYNLLLSTEASLSSFVHLYLKTDRVIENEPILQNINQPIAEPLIAKRFSESNQIYRTELNLGESLEQEFELRVIRENDQDYIDTLQFGVINQNLTKSQFLDKYKLSVFGKIEEQIILFSERFRKLDENLEITMKSNSKLKNSGLILNGNEFEFKVKDYTKQNWISIGKKLPFGKYDKFKLVRKQGNAPQSHNVLSQNIPNPFNLSTKIGFKIKEEMNVSLNVYNTIGQKVKTIHTGRLREGEHHFLWNGKNDQDNTISSGIYFYVLKGKNILLSKKMILLK